MDFFFPAQLAMSMNHDKRLGDVHDLRISTGLRSARRQKCLTWWIGFPVGGQKIFFTGHLYDKYPDRRQFMFRVKGIYDLWSWLLKTYPKPI
ncbi:hypothetical protein POX_b02580 [Penicillium oxalicum]|uniref:Uncharacterized protein n=1 Tax=Penicillium oxalicum (strain 114-2 / CGMCC 5302) TaxID=933388 RepID=S7ZJE7_PENO1|nr:hypothetical protein POX_b02580 [Penicillium oxalicum]EPS30409.1 hypothetical protein PDE_05360 [Penicillium oxalicum 114-2]KAI2792542.1 hypothetical protein POX_b02580 [Penicillium oxalicum]